MRRRLAIAAVVFGLTAGSCSTSLGVGLPECEDVPRRPTSAIILSVQAVPSAEYAPCIDELKLGWDSVAFQVESGRAQFSIPETPPGFLTVSLTPTCDVSGATPVPGPRPDIEKYEAIEREVDAVVRIAIVPTGGLALVYGESLAREYEGVEVGGRATEFIIDRELDLDVRSRVNRAFFNADFVWIAGELDAVEDKVELRRSADASPMSGLSPDEALDRIGDLAGVPIYEGRWYFTFTGGCITYDFNAKGRVAETIAEDVTSALGFYDLDALRELARRAGVDVPQLPPPDGS